MKILDARVRDMPALGWSNPPKLEILVDHVPTWEEIKELPHRTVKTSDLADLSEEQSHIVGEFSHKTKDEYTAYLAEKDGYVHYFLHNSRNESGYGGSIFDTLLEDGTRVQVKGPWSSNPFAMREFFGLDIIHVSMTDDPEVLVKGYTFRAGDITLELAKQAIPFIEPNFTITDTSPYLTRLTPLVPIYPEGSPNWHKREYQKKHPNLSNT